MGDKVGRQKDDGAASRGGRTNVEQIGARVSGGGGHYKDVLFDCTLDASGRITKALDVNDQRTNAYVEVVEAGVYEVHRGHLVERLEVVRYSGAGEHSFCVRVTDEEGRLKYVCDLEGYIPAAPGTTTPCPKVPKPVLDELLAGIAQGATLVRPEEEEAEPS